MAQPITLKIMIVSDKPKTSLVTARDTVKGREVPLEIRAAYIDRGVARAIRKTDAELQNSIRHFRSKLKRDLNRLDLATDSEELVRAETRLAADYYELKGMRAERDGRERGISLERQS